MDGKYRTGFIWIEFIVGVDGGCWINLSEMRKKQLSCVKLLLGEIRELKPCKTYANAGFVVAVTVCANFVNRSPSFDVPTEVDEKMIAHRNDSPLTMPVSD